MFDYKKNYIITLVDASENEIENNICMEGFAHHQFLLVDSNGYAISQETKEIPFNAGDVIYVAAGRRFGIRCDGTMHIRHIAFTGRNIRPLLHYCGFGEFCITPSSDKNNIDSIFDEIFAFKSSDATNKYMELSVLLYSLLAQLGEINIETKNRIPEKNALIIKPVIDFMQQNYRNPSVSYDEITAMLGMTVSELDKLFIEVFFLPLSDFYNRLRMENAKHLLFFYASHGIEYVAKNMGYKNVIDFKSDFFEQFNITTDEFTELYWQKKSPMD